MGSLVSQENEYLVNVLRLIEIRTEDILTPRSVVHCVDETMTVEQVLELEQTKQLTRIPVYQDQKDNIIGLVTNRELLFEDREGHADEPVSQYTKPIYRVSAQLPVQKLLDQFIKKREHLFLVDDQFGQPVGIVTLEDAIETILGREIVDETDTIEDLQKYAKGQYRSRLREDKES
jgi:CBS domain containing-hemolysin-like protein